MPDPAAFKSQALPEPHSSVAGRYTTDNGFARAAAKFRPKDSTLEPPAATVSRYSARLLDLATGKAFTVGELIDHLIADGIFPALDANGNISVNGLAPRVVEEAQRGTDVPVLNELVWVGGTGGCLCRGDGVKTVSQLEWLGTHRIEITEEAAFVAPVSNASRLEITTNLDLSSDDMEIRLEQFVDGTGAGFTKHISVRVPGQSSQAFRIKGYYANQFFDTEGESLSWNIGVVNTNGIGGWMILEIVGDKFVVVARKVDSTAIYS